MVQGWVPPPRTLAQPLIVGGALVETGFQNASNEVCLLVGIVWPRERPMGLGARRHVEPIRQAWPAGPGASQVFNRGCASGRPARRAWAG
jgi:hypothetical protein